MADTSANFGEWAAVVNQCRALAAEVTTLRAANASLVATNNALQHKTLELESALRESRRALHGMSQEMSAKAQSVDDLMKRLIAEHSAAIARCEELETQLRLSSAKAMTVDAACQSDLWVPRSPDKAPTTTALVTDVALDSALGVRPSVSPSTPPRDGGLESRFGDFSTPRLLHPTDDRDDTAVAVLLSPSSVYSPSSPWGVRGRRLANSDRHRRQHTQEQQRRFSSASDCSGLPPPQLSQTVPWRGVPQLVAAVVESANVPLRVRHHDAQNTTRDGLTSIAVSFGGWWCWHTVPAADAVRTVITSVLESGAEPLGLTSSSSGSATTASCLASLLGTFATGPLRLSAQEITAQLSEKAAQRTLLFCTHSGAHDATPPSCITAVGYVGKEAMASVVSVRPDSGEPVVSLLRVEDVSRSYSSFYSVRFDPPNSGGDKGGGETHPSHYDVRFSCVLEKDRSVPIRIGLTSAPGATAAAALHNGAWKQSIQCSFAFVSQSGSGWQCEEGFVTPASTAETTAAAAYMGGAEAPRLVTLRCPCGEPGDTVVVLLRLEASSPWLWTALNFLSASSGAAFDNGDAQKHHHEAVCLAPHSLPYQFEAEDRFGWCLRLDGNGAADTPVPCRSTATQTTFPDEIRAGSIHHQQLLADDIRDIESSLALVESIPGGTSRLQRVVSTRLDVMVRHFFATADVALPDLTHAAIQVGFARAAGWLTAAIDSFSAALDERSNLFAEWVTTAHERTRRDVRGLQTLLGQTMRWVTGASEHLIALNYSHLDVMLSAAPQLASVVSVADVSYPDTDSFVAAAAHALHAAQLGSLFALERGSAMAQAACNAATDFARDVQLARQRDLDVIVSLQRPPQCSVGVSACPQRAHALQSFIDATVARAETAAAVPAYRRATAELDMLRIANSKLSVALSTRAQLLGAAEDRGAALSVELDAAVSKLNAADLREAELVQRLDQALEAHEELQRRAHETATALATVRATHHSVLHQHEVAMANALSKHEELETTIRQLQAAAAAAERPDSDGMRGTAPLQRVRSSSIMSIAASTMPDSGDTPRHLTAIDPLTGKPKQLRLRAVERTPPKRKPLVAPGPLPY